jgi:hypothetical protein
MVLEPSVGQGLRTGRYETGSVAYNNGLWQCTGSSKKSRSLLFLARLVDLITDCEISLTL